MGRGERAWCAGYSRIGCARVAIGEWGSGGRVRKGGGGASNGIVWGRGQ